jgi:hypothetical protein
MTTVGSTGIVDETDSSLVAFDGPYVFMNPSAPVGSILNLRYSIPHILVTGMDDYVFLQMRFADSGASSRVIVRLREYDLFTGILTTKMTMDSDRFAPSPSFQTQTVSASYSSFDFDFRTKSYFLDVELRKVESGGNPWLAAMKLRTEVQ